MPRRKRPTLQLTRTKMREFEEIELEIMRRLVEGEKPEKVREALHLDEATWKTITGRVQFRDTLDDQQLRQSREISTRVSNLASEALDVVREIMREATHPSYRLKAALEILDRSGNVKIEKRLTITADAESVIKLLNQQGVEPAQLPEPLEAEVVEDEEDPFEKAAQEAASELR